MFEGDLLVGSFANGQVGYERPFLGAGNYRTPIDSLYLRWFDPPWRKYYRTLRIHQHR